MPRIAGIDIPDHLKLEYALQAIYGVGPRVVKDIINQAKLDPNKRARELTDSEISAIHKVLDNMLIEGALRQQINQNITRLKNIKAYRGLRHMQNLPVRGQRTKTNARTKRGKRKTVGAYKKSDLAKMQQR